MILRLKLGHLRFDLRRGEGVIEFQAERGDDVARAQVHSDQAVGAFDARLLAGDFQDGAIDRAGRGLTDKQPFGFVRNDGGHDREQQPDGDRRRTVERRHLQHLRRRRSDAGNDDADHRGTVLEQNEESRRVLAPPHRLEIAERAFRFVEFTPRDPPGAAFEDERAAEHDVVHCGMRDRLRVEQVQNSFDDGGAGADREDQQRDHEAPEIELPAVAERMAIVRRGRGTMHAVKHQALIGGVDQRMKALAQHGRTAGPQRGGKLGDCDEQIARQRGIDDGLRG